MHSFKRLPLGNKLIKIATIKSSNLKTSMHTILLTITLAFLFTGCEGKKTDTNSVASSKSSEKLEATTAAKETFNYQWQHEIIKDPMTDKITINSVLFDETKSSWLGFMCAQSEQSVFTWKVAPSSDKKYEFGTNKWDIKVDIRFDEAPMLTENWTLDLRYGVLPVSREFINNMMGKRKVALRANILGNQSTFVYMVPNVVWKFSNLGWFQSHSLRCDSA